MECLWNGEYGEHDLSHINGLDWIMKNHSKIYKQYLGIVIGDFTCIEVEYDWGKRDQRWKVRCNLCGEETYKYHTGDWRRGKGGKTTCHCRTDEAVEKRRKKKLEHDRIESEEVGKVYGNFKIIKYTPYGNCVVQCEKCGKVKRGSTPLDKVKTGEYLKCICDKQTSGWIGKRVGHLVVQEKTGPYYKCICDCGAERYCNSNNFRQKFYHDCGRPECVYASEQTQRARGCRIRGESYEYVAEALLISSGYKTEHIGRKGDFGVDIIATDKDGNKIAIQCKSNSRKTKIDAVQQVYSGGRYYDISRFAVISHSGYSVQAVRMAKKLGVYLSDGTEFVYPEDIASYSVGLIPTVEVTKNEKAMKLYEIDGIKMTLPNIAFKYGVSTSAIRKGLERGLTIENAIKYKPKRKTYTVRGVTGTLTQLHDRFGIKITTAAVSYRLRRGWTIEDALFR